MMYYRVVAEPADILQIGIDYTINTDKTTI